MLARVVAVLDTVIWRIERLLAIFEGIEQTGVPNLVWLKHDLKTERPLAETALHEARTTAVVTARRKSRFEYTVRTLCSCSDHSVVILPRRTIRSDLTSKMSAKSHRKATSSWKRTGFMLLLVMSRSSCRPPLSDRLMVRPRVRGGISPS